MAIPEINKIIGQFFLASRSEREDVLKKNITAAINDLDKRGILSSSIAVNNISAVYTEEIKLRFESAWDSIKKYFDKQKIALPKGEIEEVEELTKQLVNIEIENLSKRIDSRFLKNEGPLDFKNSILLKMASARNTIFPRISADLNYYIASSSDKNAIAKETTPKGNFVDTQRIEELKIIKNKDYDLARLIRLCEEINVAHNNDCYMSIAMILRSIIDHIPPIFNASSFSGVANNYGGPKSFKDSMNRLQGSLRSVADLHLHVQIRKSETLPALPQINFMPELDLLLSEIIRILKQVVN